MGERLFAAVLPPGEVLDDLARWVDPRRDDAWRWAEASTWHITLAFYENVDPWRYDALVEALASAARRAPAFRLTLRGVGCFPSVARARVLYAGVDDPTASLAPLAARAHTAATSNGIEVARESYTPHVTLARRNRPEDASRYVRALTALETPAWGVQEIVLVESFLGQGPGGRPRYEVRERLPLTP